MPASPPKPNQNPKPGYHWVLHKKTNKWVQVPRDAASGPDWNNPVFSGGLPQPDGTPSTPASNAATFITPAAPGVPNPPRTPTPTSAQIRSQADAQAVHAGVYADLDKQLADMLAANNYEFAQIDKGVKFGKRDASDEAAGRGMFMSSVRDAELYDIDATATVRKQFLDTQLGTTTLDAQRRKTEADRVLRQFNAGLDEQMILDAQAATEGQGEWLRPPVPATYTPAPAAPAPAAPAAPHPPKPSQNPNPGMKWQWSAGQNKWIQVKR